MKRVVITGSTRGIGRGLAVEFLQRGHHVMISGRSADGVQAVVDELAARFDAAHVAGQACDVSQPQQLQALWDAAVAHFGGVDIWVNNAGIANQEGAFWDQPLDSVTAVTAVNLSGLMAACHIAMRGMVAQGGGQIYNMEGLGSGGEMRPGLTAYGTTKYGVRYFTRALAKEASSTPVQVGALSPGMVVTDLLIADLQNDPAAFERARRIFNILADRVDTVAAFLVTGMLANTRNDAHIIWLTRPKIALRFLLAPIRKRDLFADLTVE